MKFAQWRRQGSSRTKNTAAKVGTGAAIGAQIGAISTQYFAGPKIRLLFVPLPMIGAAIVIYTLLTGLKL